MDTPVSILICTRNRVEPLRQTLASVAQLDVPEGLRPECIVVDNAATDGTAEMARAFTLPNMPLRLVGEHRPGASHARNTALREATGDIILFTDDDIRLPKDWIAGMCKPILAGTADAVAGRVVLAPHLQRPWMQPFHRAILAATDFLDEENPSEMFGASMAFSRAVLDAVPVFDPELGPGALGTAEDTLFSWQLREAGYRIVLARDVVVEHHPDEARLSRAAYIAAAGRLGRCRAYIAYHWQHEPEIALQRISIPWLNLALRSLRLGLRRCLRWTECRGAEGIPLWEFIEIRHLCSVRQYRTEQRRPRNYERRGLQRRPGGPSFPQCAPAETNTERVRSAALHAGLPSTLASS